MRGYCMRVAFAIVGSFFLVTLAQAQQGGSAIRGRVADQQNAILPGVAIVVTHAESGTIRETVTGADGTFLVPGLVPGPYRITAQLQGFSRLTQENLVLRVGSTLQVDLVMRIGAMEESLTVTAEAPQVELTSAQVGGNVSAGDIESTASMAAAWSI
jgi:hypothetical protein